MSSNWDSHKNTVFSFEKDFFSKASYSFKKYFPNTERPDLVSELLRETSFTVIEKIEEGILIENLAAYYATVFDNKLKNFSRNKSENFNEILEDDELENAANDKYYIDEFEMKILVKEIIRKMSKEVKFIFEKKLSGFEYREIQEPYNKEFSVDITPNYLRQKFAREIKTLAKLINTSQKEKVS